MIVVERNWDGCFFRLLLLLLCQKKKLSPHNLRVQQHCNCAISNKITLHPFTKHRKSNYANYKLCQMNELTDLTSFLHSKTLSQTWFHLSTTKNRLCGNSNGNSLEMKKGEQFDLCCAHTHTRSFKQYTFLLLRLAFNHVLDENQRVKIGKDLTMARRSQGPNQ